MQGHVVANSVLQALTWHTPTASVSRALMNIIKWLFSGLFCSPTNPLTTNDDNSHHRNSVACYQLAQSTLKVGSALAERMGREEVGGCHPEGDSAWWLLQLAVEKPWSVPGGPFVCFLAQTGVENALFTL